MRVLPATCRNGHKLAGENVLWHTRYKDGEKFMVRECRTCANERYRLKRLAEKRNMELAEKAAAGARS